MSVSLQSCVQLLITTMQESRDCVFQAVRTRGGNQLLVLDVLLHAERYHLRPDRLGLAADLLFRLEVSGGSLLRRCILRRKRSTDITKLIRSLLRFEIRYVWTKLFHSAGISPENVISRSRGNFKFSVIKFIIWGVLFCMEFEWRQTELPFMNKLS